MANQDIYGNPDPMTGTGASETAEDLKRKASDLSSKAKAGLSDAVQTGKQKAEQARYSTADGLQKAASKVHETADRLPGGQTTQRAAHAVASGMERSASYIRENDLSDMASDVEDLVRQHPGKSLIAAVAAGFVLGSALRRR